MGNPQPPTLMQLDKYTAVVFFNKTTKQKLSKAIDMRFYWIQDREAQEQFKIYWRPLKGYLQNLIRKLGDFHTKHFTKANQIICRLIYL